MKQSLLRKGSYIFLDNNKVKKLFKEIHKNYKSYLKEEFKKLEGGIKK